MANYVIPPTGKDIIFIKCAKCKTLYSPEAPSTPMSSEMYHKNMRNVVYYAGGISDLEPCPYCGYTCNGWNNTISYTKYKIIAFLRGVFLSK